MIEGSSDRIEFNIKVGMFEIYNEKVYDLLDPTESHLAIKEDKIRGIYVQDLYEVGNIIDYINYLSIWINEYMSNEY